MTDVRIVFAGDSFVAGVGDETSLELLLDRKLCAQKATAFVDVTGQPGNHGGPGR